MKNGYLTWSKIKWVCSAQKDKLASYRAKYYHNGIKFFFFFWICIKLFKLFIPFWLNKGQFISKWIFCVFNSHQNRRMSAQIGQGKDSNFQVRFLGELKTLKRHFEINWPLEDASSTMVEIEGITAISSIKGPLKFFLGNCTEVNHVCPRRQCWLLWHWP
jgi:hypothetical protein